MTTSGAIQNKRRFIGRDFRYFLMIASIIVVMLIPLSISAGSITARERYQEGLEYSKKMNWEMAISCFTADIYNDPHREIYYRARAIAELFSIEGLGKEDQSTYLYSALADMNTAIKLNPEGESYVIRGIIYFCLKLKDEARTDFKEACDLGVPEGCKNYDNLVKGINEVVFPDSE